MTLCPNPSCPAPQNSDSAQSCRSCGAGLLLQERYLLLKLLGQGGFGRTFLAREEGEGQGGERREERGVGGGGSNQAGLSPNSTPTTPSPGRGAWRAPSFKQLLVVKQLWPSQSQSSSLFQAEAQRLRELGQHPQIPTFVEAFEDNGQAYLVQSYVAGPTLEQVLTEQGVFDEAQVWELLNSLLPVLKFIHDRNIIHRDIKPANLIRCSGVEDANATWVLVDFGAAKQVQADDQLRKGTVIGSAEYVAPEQARGKAVFASDLYSLGLICIHLLTGLSPFDLFDPITNDWVWQPYLTQLVSEPLEALLNRLLQHGLSQRFQSANEVMQFLQKSTHSPVVGTMSNPAYSPITNGKDPIVLTGHIGSVNEIAFTPDGKYLASGGDDKTIRLWEAATGNAMVKDQPIRAIATLTGHSKPIKSLLTHQESDTSARTLLISASEDKNLRLWDVSSQTCVQTITGHTQMVTAVALIDRHSDQDWLLLSGSWDKTVRLWHGPTGESLGIIAQHRLPVTAIAVSQSPPLPTQSIAWIASASCDRTAHLYTLYPTKDGYSAKRQHVLTDHIGPVLTVAFNPEGTLLATGSDDRTIKLWEVATGKLVQTLSSHSWAVVALAFTPEGQTLVSGSWDGTIKLWPIRGLGVTPQPETLTGHTDSVNAIAISPDGKTIASASRDGTVRIWL